MILRRRTQPHGLRAPELARSSRLLAGRHDLLRCIVLVGAILESSACGGGASGARSSFPSDALPRILQHDVERHPRLVTLEREGDPQSALALRVSNPSYVLDDSVQLAALLSVRLRDAVPSAKVSVDLAGVTLSTAVESPSALRALATRFDAAVRTKVASAMATSPRFQEELARFRQILSGQVSDSDQAACLAPGREAAKDLEQLRSSAFVQAGARWGVVGTREIVNAAGTTIRALPVWPDADSHSPSWPERNVALLKPAQAPRVDMTWRVPNSRRSFAVQRAMRDPTSHWRDVLATLPLPMRMERILVTPMAEGACLGISLVPESDGTATTLDDLLSAARIAARELQSLSVADPGDESATLTVLEEADPRNAARLAITLASSRDAKGKPDRFRLEISSGAELSGLNPTPSQRSTLAAILATEPPASGIELVKAVEKGQGRLHALLASPCASWIEPAKLAGVTGLLMRVLGAHYHEFNGITLEPWVTADGVGLVAHTGRRSANETPEDMAARLGDALGRVLGTARFDANDVWRTRSELLASLGPGPRPALWRALQAFSPQQPGLVLPDGTHASVEAISVADLREQRTRFLRLPLRLAVLSNAGPRQAEIVQSSLSHWLSLVRSEETRCPNWQEPLPLVRGEVRVQTREDSGDASVTMAMALPAADRLDEAHAVLLLQMLNGPSGWLSEQLRTSGLVGTSEARVVGGSRRRGLVVALGTLPSVADAATAAVRGLFEQVANGHLPAQPSLSAAIAQRALSDGNVRFDPRSRLEDLWLPRSSRPKLSERSMREYLKRAFAGLELFVVRSERLVVAEPAAAPRSKR